MLGIEFMSTAFDEEALDFLVELGIKWIKVPSGEITNIPFITHMAAKELKPSLTCDKSGNLSQVADWLIFTPDRQMDAPINLAISLGL